MTTKPFYVAEIGAYQPAGPPSSYVLVPGAAPWGALSRAPAPLEASTILRFSDDGYRTRATDPDGVVVYAPVIDGSFAIDRSVGLTPADGPTVNWGSIQIIDSDDRIAALMQSWSIEGQTVTIRRGEKTFEDFQGYGTVRSTKATYIDAGGILREAAAGLVRWDYSGGATPIALNEAAGKNWIRNPRGEGAVVAATTELVTNGTFAANPLNGSQNTLQNGWYWSVEGGTSTVTWGSGAVTVTADGTNRARVDTAIATTSGKAYVVACDVTTNVPWLAIGTSQGGGTISAGFLAGAGTGQRRMFTATGATTWLRFERLAAGAFTLDNVSVKEAGSLPTNWAAVPGTSALAYTVAATGAENGVPYVDIRIAGRTAATAYSIQADTGISGTKGDTWTVSAWTKLAGGTLTNITTVALEVMPSSGTTITGSHTPTGVLARRDKAGTLSATANLAPQLTLTFSSGVAIDATIRIGAPQLEQAAAVSSVILPPAGAPAATSREADRLYTARQIWVSPPLAELKTVFTGMAGAWQANEDGITIPIRGADYWLDQPVRRTFFAGTGTYEGDTSLTGQSVPQARGAFYNAEPTLISATKLIYQYNKARGTVTALYENGNAGIPWDGTDTTNLFSGSPDPGKYRTDNSRGLFQLGSPPAGQITVSGTGEFPVAGNKTVLVDIARYILTEDMAIPADFIDTASFSAAASAWPYTGGIWLLPEETAGQAVYRTLLSAGLKLVPGRNGKLRVIALGAPAGSPVATLGTHNIIKIEPVALPDTLSPPPYRVRCGYQHNYTVQTNVSDSATAAHVQFIAAEDRFATFIDTNVLARYRKSNDLAPFGGCLDNETHAQAVVSRVGGMVSTPRRFYAVTLPISVGIDLDIGDLVQITYPLDVLRGGKLAIVDSEQFRSQDEIIFLVLV